MQREIVIFDFLMERIGVVGHVAGVGKDHATELGSGLQGHASPGVAKSGVKGLVESGDVEGIHLAVEGRQPRPRRPVLGLPLHGLLQCVEARRARFGVGVDLMGVVAEHGLVSTQPGRDRRGRAL